MSAKLDYCLDEPIAALATALVPSALAVVRLSGGGTLERLSKIFSRPKALLSCEGQRILYGWLCDGSKKIDEVEVAVYREGKSYTGEEMAEIFCHGGIANISRVLSLVLRSGFRQAQRGEFTYRAFANGKSDLTKAEAVREIVDAKTGESCASATKRLGGTLWREIQKAKSEITAAAAHVSAGIEYPEEEVLANSFDSAQIVRVRATLQRLSDSWKTEKIFQQGAQIVLVGKTNAGKSSLFNAILGESRSIVSEIHGTTRDWVECSASFAGIPVRLFDTAGLRETDDAIEREGVSRSRGLAELANIVFYLVDSSAGLCDEDSEFLQRLQKSGGKFILVWTKKDLCDIELAEKPFLQAKICANTGDGIPDLIEKTKEILFGEREFKSYDENFCALGSERQKSAVDSAIASIDRALCAEKNGFGQDAALQDLDDALFSLSQITGEASADDVLNEIFSRFCVGK